MGVDPRHPRNPRSLLPLTLPLILPVPTRLVFAEVRLVAAGTVYSRPEVRN
jgi:hypothetical protein